MIRMEQGIGFRLFGVGNGRLLRSKVRSIGKSEFGLFFVEMC
jgi:hypothetical protein